MASGLCVRVLLLSLLAFGPHAEAPSYRSGGSSGVTPYFKSPSALLGDQNPGLASSSYESSAQADGSQGGSGPSYPEGGSSDELEPAGAGGDTGYYGRQVDGNSQERSVSSYRPDPIIPSKPSYQPKPQQPSSYQPKPQKKPGTPSTDFMWDFALSHDVAFDPYEELPTYPEVNVGPRNFRPTYMVAPNHPGWQQRVAR
ncbi:adhesive plaque matrix protein-like [Hippoglossus hippoglossus]|uniref:adhesive plaque matrix protein-like n=1 Tax=Hippoglossus hippoglossus TaxID=8267 RepID=UPI00148DA602|nr:adhesive plaque matrix protein-like [Hippoglossus hippoglossus]